MNKSSVKTRHQFQAFLKGLDHRALSIRLSVLLAAALMITFAWYLVLWVPVSFQQQYAEQKVAEQEVQKKKVFEEIRSMALGNSIDKNQAEIQHLETLKKQQATLEHQIKDYTDQFVPAEQRDEVLREVMIGNPGLTRQTLKNTSIHTIGSIVVNGKTRPIQQENTTLVISGNYFAVIQYLQHITTLPWQVFFESLQYEVTRYPEAKVTLNFYTLTW
jgi:MSHA biogenesis protein MshJ